MNKLYNSKFSILNILKFATICLLAGRAWQFIFWDAPLRAFFWDENLLSQFVVPHLFESWNDYATNLAVDQFIINTKFSIGIIFAITAILLILSLKKKVKVLQISLLLSSIFLVLLTLLMWKEKFYQIGQLIEYSSQVLCPILLILWLFKNKNPQKFTMLIKIAVAMTFIGHGLYAFGYHPQPGHFVDMMITVFPLQESDARLALKFIGVLDFIAAIAIFFPKTFKVSIWYIIIWALLTSFARIVANIDFTFIWQSLNQWIFEVLIRVPHFVLPIILFLMWNKEKQEQNKELIYPLHIS